MEEREQIERNCKLRSGERESADYDFDYSEDEKRVAYFLHERGPGVGAGTDPIGFLMASYVYVMDSQLAGARAQNAILREALTFIADKGFGVDEVHIVARAKDALERTK